MKFNRVKSIYKRKEFSNSVWNMTDMLILPFLMLLFTPFFISRIGAEQYGLWMFVNSIVASIGILNMGLGDATIKFTSKYKTLDDFDNLNRIVSSLFGLSLIFLIVFFVLGVGFAFIIKYFTLFNLNSSELQTTFYIIQLGSLIFGLKQVEQVLLSIFKGFEAYKSSAVLSIFSKFLLIFSQAIVAYLGYFLIEIFIVSSFILFVIVFFEFLFVKNKNKKILFKLNFNKITFKEIFGFSSWSWIQSIIGVIASHIDRLFVISFAGPKFLAYYALASNIGGQVHSVLIASVGWVFPKVSAKTERQEDISKLYYKLQFILISLSILIFGILLIFDDLIFKTWLGFNTYNNSILLIEIFLYLAFFNAFSIVPYYFFLGSNKIKLSTIFMFISLALTVVFMFIGYKIWDANGLAYGKLISSIISIPIMLFFVHSKVINNSEIKLGVEIYLPSILFALSVFIINIYSIPILTLGLLVWGYLLKKIFV